MRPLPPAAPPPVRDDEALFETLIDDLIGQGWSVQPAFLGPEAVRLLREETEAQWHAGRFRAAGIGRGGGYQVARGIRGDQIRWLEGDGAGPAQRDYLGVMERLRLALRHRLHLPLHEFEVHAARYPAGAGYARHLDRFAGSDERLVTCVLYLNAGWRAEEGGALRLETADGPLDILPQGGLLATFVTEGMWHEVLPATRPRLALTGWYRRHAPPLPGI